MKTINGFNIIATQEEINKAIEQLGEEFTKEEFENALSNIRLELSKTLKLNDIKTDYESSVKNMIGDTDTSEMASWTKQESEARAWITDNMEITPIIDNLIIGRAMEETKAELVAKIIIKADAYAVAYAQVLGQYHAKQKAIEVATTVTEVEAI